MKNIFIDTNVIIDLLAKRNPFYIDSSLIFSLADREQVKLSISALSFANTNYILSSEKSYLEARQSISKIKVLVTIVSLTDKIIGLALDDFNFKDFEDGLQYYSALENQANIILTRNKKDFLASSIPVLTPTEFLASL